LIASIVTVIYSSLGGLRGVLITDFFQFIISMIGSVWAASIIVNLPEVGGISELITHERVSGKLNVLPDFNDPSVLIPVFVIPIAVQWWSVWYPGSEPGGGGYVAQRMLSAKNENHAIGATFLFNAAHYALRPWPWILIALASLIIFPDLASLQNAFPQIEKEIVQNDLGYPAMLTYLPHGLLGVVVASLIAAFMSTISTHLNWGSSYLVHDFYKRFLKPEASEKELVAVGRWSTVFLMLFSAIFALLLSNALQAFNILLSIGAGTGLIYILRWFWYRINAYTEITGMVVSFIVAIYFQVIHPLLGYEPITTYIQLILSIGITTVAWLIITIITPPENDEVLIRFYKLVKPDGPGWFPVKGLVTEKVKGSSLPLEILSVLVGCLTIYCTLFATGFWIYGESMTGIILTISALLGAFLLIFLWKRINPFR
jgi:Na+/proline symporter